MKTVLLVFVCSITGIYGFDYNEFSLLKIYHEKNKNLQKGQEKLALMKKNKQSPSAIKAQQNIVAARRSAVSKMAKRVQAAEDRQKLHAEYARNRQEMVDETRQKNCRALYCKLITCGLCSGLICAGVADYLF